MKITTVYDNEVYPGQEVSATGLKSEWGFSCLIEVSGEQILFDTNTGTMQAASLICSI